MSQDIEIDPDSRTITYYEKPTETSIREHISAGGTLINHEQTRLLLDEIDRLRKESAERQQAGLDLCDENERLAKENEFYRRDAQDNRYENEHLRKLIPPDSERGPGFVGQGTWSVFAEKVVAERDYLQEALSRTLAERDDARDELNTLCEDIRTLKEECDDLKEATGDRIRELLKENSELHRANAGLQEEVTRCANVVGKEELAYIHYGRNEFLGIDGYGPFSLKQVSSDRWEVQMLQMKVTLYNKKGRRVRAHIVDGNQEGDM